LVFGEFAFYFNVDISKGSEWYDIDVSHHHHVKAGVNKYYYIFSYGSSEHLQNINNIYK
jgi:hypothetical protein